MINLSAADKAKQDAARENDGKFGPQLRGELEGGSSILGGMPVSASTAVLNTPSARVKVESYGDNLPEWPDGYPKPEVSWEFDDGKPKTRITVGDDVWTLETNDDGLSRRALFDDSVFGDDYDALDTATEWAEEVHKRIDTAVYSVSMEAAGSVGVNASILKFATTDNDNEPKAESPALEPEFETVVRELEAEADRSRRRLQHAYMLKAFTEMPKSVASFYLMADDDRLTTGDVLDAEGNPVPDEDAQELAEVFRYRTESDYTAFIDQTVNVQDTLSAW